MAFQDPVNTGTVDRQGWRPARRSFAVLALTAVVGATACGAASAVEPPLALSRAAGSTFDDEGAVTVSLAASDPEDAEMAEVLSHLALKVDWSPSGNAVRVLVDGNVGAEVLTSDERVCARADIEAFESVAGWEPGEAARLRDEAVASIGDQLGGMLGNDVERLASGEWGCVTLAALEELQGSLPADTMPTMDPALIGQLTTAMRDAADGLIDPWSVREEGEDDEFGRHLVASVDAAELAQAMGGFVDVLQQQLADLGALDQLEGITGMSDMDELDELAGGQWSTAVDEALANAQGEINLDFWVDGDELTRAQVDLIAGGEALSGESAEGATGVLTMDFDSSADLPEVAEDAVDLDGFLALAGLGLANMGQGF